jgi:cell division protein FtsQ
MMLRRRSNYRLDASPRVASPAVGGLRLTLAKVAADAGMALLAAALLAGFFFGSRVFLQQVRTSETFRLHTILVEGNQKFSPQEILKMGRVEKGGSIFDINPAGVQELIERQPWIKEAEVKKVWPDALKIRVKERTISATVLVGGALYHVDGDGEIFERPPDGGAIQTILITGIDDDLVLQNRELAAEEIRRILQVVERYRSMGLEPFAPVGEVHREVGGGLVVYTRTEAREIRLGSGSYVRKLKNLRALFKYLDKSKKEWDYILLDSETSPDRIVAKLR